MSRSTAAFAVLYGPGASPAAATDLALHTRLSAAGLDPSLLTAPDSAGIILQIVQESAWETLNLAALVAAARARPGLTVELRPAPSSAPAALAVAGPADLLSGPPAWRLEWPGPSRPTAAFLDRDGTIIEDRHYLAEAEGVALLPGAAEGLRGLAALGMRLVILTNQSGVASGRIHPEELAAIHARLAEMLSAQGVRLDGIFTCPHFPDEHCACRKPADGLARQAAAELGIDLRHVLVVGDKDSDLGLGRRLNVPAFLVVTGEGLAPLSSRGPPADYLVDDLREVARIVAHPAGLARLQLILGNGAPING